MVTASMGRVSESLPPGGQLAIAGIPAQPSSAFAFDYSDRNEQIGQDSRQACVVSILGNANHLPSVLLVSFELCASKRGSARTGTRRLAISCGMVREKSNSLFLSDGLQL